MIIIGAAKCQGDPCSIAVADLKKLFKILSQANGKKLKDHFNIVKNRKGKLKTDCVFSRETLLY
ncbi:hypothetical protein [Candidatus Williamhamiltonella defendens]|uniref:hypothetical protein n=1 Tax=Candidatus Williamhamiltonella defendens TaxID=138072 RepID=UPI001F46FB2B